MKTIFLVTFLFTSQIFSAQYITNFTNISDASILGTLLSSVDFADVDGDGDQDILIAGQHDVFASTAPYAILYLNEGNGIYTQVPDTPFTGVELGSIDFVDVDSDNDQDVLITGGGVTKLYLNDGLGIFTYDPNTTFTGVTYSSSSIADVDGDGDQDILISGRVNNTIKITELYINNGLGVYTVSTEDTFEGIWDGDNAFGDIDGDGDQDVILTGFNEDAEGITKMYTNNGSGVFTEVTEAAFVNVSNSSLAFADVDGDDDLDVVISGRIDEFANSTRLYTNDGDGVFTAMSDTLFYGLYNGSVDFGDVDGDGDQDLLYTGTTSGWNGSTLLYYNDGTGIFTTLNSPFVDAYYGDAVFVDIDNDNDLDVFVTGDGTFDGQGYARLYRNEGSTASVYEDSNGFGITISIYPNPTKEKINIEYDSIENKTVTLRLFDLFGRLVIEQQRNVPSGQQTLTLDLSSLTTGSYILELDDENKKERLKILVE